MSRSHLQASMGFCTAYVYECRWANGRVVRGTAPEVAKAVGRSASWVRDLARNNRPSVEGWTVRQVTRLPRVRYNAVYVAERKNDDPVTGGAEEIGGVLGYSAWYVRKLCREGLMSKAGWKVRKATAEEAEAVREV